VATQQVSKYELGSNGLHSYSLYKVAHKVFNINMDVLADPKMITKYEGFRSDMEMKRIEIELLGEAKNSSEVGGKEPLPTEAQARKAAEQVYDRLKPKVI
jgi:hypothetical protein